MGLKSIHDVDAIMSDGDRLLLKTTKKPNDDHYRKEVSCVRL